MIFFILISVLTVYASLTIAILEVFKESEVVFSDKKKEKIIAPFIVLKTYLKLLSKVEKKKILKLCTVRYPIAIGLYAEAKSISENEEEILFLLEETIKNHFL